MSSCRKCERSIHLLCLPMTSSSVPTKQKQKMKMTDGWSFLYNCQQMKFFYVFKDLLNSITIEIYFLFFSDFLFFSVLYQTQSFNQKCFIKLSYRHKGHYSFFYVRRKFFDNILKETILFQLRTNLSSFSITFSVDIDWRQQKIKFDRVPI